MELTNSRTPSVHGIAGAIPISEIAAYVDRSKIDYDFDFMVKVCRELDALIMERNAKAMADEANKR